VPHFVNGISGNSFPTPFAHPPGRGLSSPLINVLWGLFNLVIGYLLYRGSKISREKIAAIVVFFAGFVALSVMGSMAFADKMH